MTELATTQHKTAPNEWDPPHSYLDFATVGPSSGWRYASGTGIIVVIWLVLGGIFTSVLLIAGVLFTTLASGVDPNSADLDPDTLLSGSGLPAWLWMLFTFISFVPFILATFLVVRYLHDRPWRSVITPFQRINWRLVGKGALIWLIPLAIGLAISLIWDRDSLDWQFEASSFIPFAVVVVTFTLIQTSAEEVFFRGYLAQWLASYRRNIYVISFVTAAIFASMHIPNAVLLGFGSGPNFILGMLPYFMVGFVWAWISYTSGTLELAIGAHFINNFVAFLFITTPDFPEGAGLFGTDEVSALGSAISTLLACVVFWFLLRKTRGTGDPLPLQPVVTRATPVAPVPVAPVPVVPVLPPSGWYPNPLGPGQRYWDGQQWTNYTAP
jgi:uncharacterized protein